MNQSLLHFRIGLDLQEVTEFTKEFKRSCKQQVLLGWGALGALPVSAIGVGPAKTEQVPVSLILLPTAVRMENRRPTTLMLPEQEARGGQSLGA